MRYPQPSAERPAFYTVAEAARMFRMSEMTLYRAIRDGEFPAVRIRGRLIIPARAIESIVDAAVDRGELVDARVWVDDPPVNDLGRPRPGANQTGAGSPITRQGARGDASSMTDRGYTASCGARGTGARGAAGGAA
jgi:excisionase family DNA binding protein